MTHRPQQPHRCHQPAGHLLPRQLRSSTAVSFGIMGQHPRTDAASLWAVSLGFRRFCSSDDGAAMPARRGFRTSARFQRGTAGSPVCESRPCALSPGSGSKMSSP